MKPEDSLRKASFSHSGSEVHWDVFSSKGTQSVIDSNADQTFALDSYPNVYGKHAETLATVAAFLSTDTHLIP